MKMIKCAYKLSTCNYVVVNIQIIYDHIYKYIYIIPSGIIFLQLEKLVFSICYGSGLLVLSFFCFHLPEMSLFAFVPEEHLCWMQNFVLADFF